MGKLMRQFDKYLSTVILCCMVILVVVQVTMRTVFNVPLIGPEELARYFLICIVFLAMPYTARSGGHIRMTELQSFFPKKIRTVLHYLITLCAIAVFGSFAAAAMITTLKNQGNVTPTLAIPFTLFFLPTMLGFSLLTVEYLIRFITLIQGEQRKNLDREDKEHTHPSIVDGEINL